MTPAVDSAYHNITIFQHINHILRRTRAGLLLRLSYGGRPARRGPAGNACNQSTCACVVASGSLKVLIAPTLSHASQPCLSCDATGCRRFLASEPSMEMLEILPGPPRYMY